MIPEYIVGCDIKQQNSFHITADSSLLFVAGGFIVLQKNKVQKHIPLFEHKSYPETEDVSSHLHNFQITSCAFHRERNVFAVSVKVFGGDVILKVASLEKKAVFRNYVVSGDILSTSFSLDGKFISCLICCDGIYKISIWEVKSSKLFSIDFETMFPSDSTLQLTSIDFGGDEAEGRCLALYTKNSVRFVNFNPEYVKSLKPCSSRNPYFEDITYTRWLNGTKVLIAGEHSLYTFDKRGEKVQIPIDSAFSLVGFYDTGIMLNNGLEQIAFDYDHVTQSLSLKRTLSTGTPSHINIKQTAVSATGNTIVVVTSDGQVLFSRVTKADNWQPDVMKNWELIQRFHVQEIRNAAFEYGKGQLVTVDSQKILYAWDFSTNVVKFMQELDEVPQRVQFHPSGKLLLIAYPDGFTQYLVTPTKFIRQSSQKIKLALGTKYNPFGSLLVTYSSSNVSIFSCRDLHFVCQLTPPKEIQHVDWIDEFTVAVKFFDNSKEVYCIKLHGKNYSIEELHEYPKPTTAQPQTNYHWNSIIEKSASRKEQMITVTNCSEINGLVTLKNDAFMTFAKDCNLMFFNIKKMQEDIRKSNSIFDEVLLLPEVCTDLTQRINLALDDLTDIKRRFNDKMDDLNSQHYLLLDNVKTEEKAQQQHLKELCSNYEKQLQKLIVQDNSQLKLLSEKQEDAATKLANDHSAEFDTAIRRIQQLDEICKTTNMRAEEKMEKLSLSYEETEKLRQSQFDREFHQLNERTRELEHKISDEKKRSAGLQKSLDEEISKELDEIQYRVFSDISAETKANAVLKQIRDQTAINYKKITDLKAETKESRDQQHQILAKLNSKLTIIQNQERTLLQSRKEKGLVMDQKDDEALELENSIKQVERNLFMIQSELKALEESENPRRELLAKYQSDAKEMLEEIGRLEKSILDWRRLDSVIESKIKVIKHRYDEHYQIYRRSKNNIELVVVDEIKRALDLKGTNMDQHKVVRKLIEDMQRDDKPGTFPGRRNSREQIEDSIAINMHIQDTMAIEKVRQRKAMVRSSKEKDLLLSQRQLLLDEKLRLRDLVERK